MRLKTLLCSMLIAAAIPSTMLRAQFLKPSSEELSMTAEARAPGADAVFLNVEETTNDTLHFYDVYERIKILTEKGRELKNVDIAYQVGEFSATDVKPQYLGMYGEAENGPSNTVRRQNGSTVAAPSVLKVVAVKARTIHSDGTIFPLTVKPEDLLPTKSSDGRLEHLSFTLPSVEVGSIVEYRYTIQYDDKHFSSPSWQIQQPYFIRKAHYRFTPFKEFLHDEQGATNRYLVDAQGKTVSTLIWWPVLPAGAAVKSDPLGVLSLDLSDIPPAPSEDWMPPVNVVSYHVNFYYLAALNKADFWTDQQRLWTKQVDRFAEPTASIRQAVAGIVAPGDSNLEIARKLYKVVQMLKNTDFASSQNPAINKPALTFASRADDVWSQKSGSSDGIALLYLAMLRAAGLTAYDMRVVDRDKGVFSSGYLSADQLDNDVIILALEGKEIYLDPGQKMCPFQAVHWKHAGASGIRQTANGTAVATTPLLSYASNSVLRTGDITFSDRTNFTGYFRFILTGQDALHWRQLTLTNGADDVKKQFDSWLASLVPAGSSATLDHFLGADDPEHNLIAVVNAQGALPTSVQNHPTLPAFFFEASSHQPFEEKPQRQQPVDMHYGQQVVDQITYHLPPTLSVQTAPANENVAMEHYATFATNVKIEAGQIIMTRSLARKFTVVKPLDYSDLRNFYTKVAEADRKQIVLAESQAASN